MIDPLWSAMENFQKIFPIVFFFAFPRFLHNGMEIALITIIYEMSSFAGIVAVQGSCMNDGNGSMTADPHPARKGLLSVRS
jgi:hypothetical protein